MNATSLLWRFQLEVPPEFDAVSMARRTLHTLLKEQHIRMRVLREIGLVVTEALNNAIENRKATDESPIELEMRLNAQKIWIAIRGSARKDGIENLKKALASADLLDMDGERGRGLFLMKELMDSVGVKRLPGGRTELWMTKNL